MELLSKSISNYKDRPVKVLQYGEGNFLRGFVEHMIDIANEKSVFNGTVVLVKPIEYGSLSMFSEQECQYTLSLRGMEDGKTKEVNRIITCVSDAIDSITEYSKYADYAKCDTLRFIVSNTTEAGIVLDETDTYEAEPPKTYPGKLTKFLHERFTYFNAANDKGLIIIPCELIENNGSNLKKCVLALSKLWNLSKEFIDWIEGSNTFCSTLVDRIVTGFPRDEAEAMCEKFGYKDNLIDTGELFALWVIESDNADVENELPLHKAGLPVIFTNDQKPYRERKVRILNGAHTSFVLASYLAGNDYVKESMEDEVVYSFMTAAVFDEIIPTLSLSEKECKEFADAVIERFKNPFIKHKLLDISLNSVSKWNARCKKSLTAYIEKYGILPIHLTFSIAALMSFYSSTDLKNGVLIGRRGVDEYQIKDDIDVLEFFAANSDKPIKEFVASYLSNEFHGEDMTRYEGLTDAVSAYLENINKHGMRKALEELMPAF